MLENICLKTYVNEITKVNRFYGNKSVGLNFFIVITTHIVNRGFKYDICFT